MIYALLVVQHSRGTSATLRSVLNFLIPYERPFDSNISSSYFLIISYSNRIDESDDNSSGLDTFIQMRSVVATSKIIWIFFFVIYVIGNFLFVIHCSTNKILIQTNIFFIDISYNVRIYPTNS